MKRLLIDSSSIVQGCLHASVNDENATVVRFEDKDVSIPSAIDGYEIFLTSLEKTLDALNMTPMQIVLVKDGKNSRALRREFLPGYKARPAKPPEFMEQFNIMQDRVEATLLSYGSISVEKEGYEADDLLAALAAVTDHVIWSKDGDLLAAGNWFFDDQLNPDKFFGIKKDHIVVFKSLVGDNSDKIPGCAGFGKVTFIDMVAKFGDEGLQDIKDMLETRQLHELEGYVSEFKPFQKILDNIDTVYNSYDAARFHHPGWNLDWKARFPSTNGDLPKWSRKEILIGKKDLTPAFMAKLKKEAALSPHYGYDLETYEDAESVEWGILNKTTKGPKLDIYGSHISGFSLTTGANCENVYYFTVEHLDSDNISLEDIKLVLDTVFDDSKKTLVHNSAFELPITRLHAELKFDRGWLPFVHDTKIMGSYVNENRELGLKPCSKLYLDYSQTTYEEVVSKIDIVDGEEVIIKRRMNEIPAAEVLSYGADDSVVTVALHNLFELIMLYEGTYHAFEECEIWSQYMFAESFLNGLKIDFERMAELEAAGDIELECVEGTLGAYLQELEWTERGEDEETGMILISHKRWKGCELSQAMNDSPLEIKGLVAQITGEPLKTNIRSLDKLAGVVGKVVPELEEAVAAGDVDEMNRIALEMFVPKPDLNVRSWVQLGEMMYEAMGLEKRLFGPLSDSMRREGRKKGNPQTDETAIRTAIVFDCDNFQKDLLLLVLRAKELRTEKSLYFDAYKKMPNPKSGLIHPNHGQSGTTTRRNNPNGMNYAQVSKKSAIREVYTPHEPNMLWLSMDWSGQELRGTAWQSQCEKMLACYPREGVAIDIHSATAVQVANLKGGNYTYDDFVAVINDKSHPEHGKFKKMRSGAKAVGFGDIYGLTVMGLARDLLISEAEAQLLFDAKDAAFPGVAKWKAARRKFFEENGYAVTLLGARKHIELDGSYKDEGVYRSAGNFEIQSSASEQMKVAVSKMWVRRLFERYPEMMFLLVVHDEVDKTVTPGPELYNFIREAHGIMLEQYATQDLPVESSIELGRNFGSLTDIGVDFTEEELNKIVEEMRNAKK